MAVKTAKLALNNVGFPLLSRWAGRPVIMPDLDISSQQTQVEAPRTLQKPHVVYAENVLPTIQGFQSVGYSPKIPAVTGASFDELWVIRDNLGGIGLFVPANGGNYFWHLAAATWVSTGANPVGFVTTNDITHATTGDQSYICWGYAAIESINCTTGVRTPVTLTGLASTLVKGICASGNYLIAYDDKTIYWSSPTNPLDMTPSLITGAGSAIPTDLIGIIIAVYPAVNGFLIYTTTNVIQATYSNNATYPWVFRALAGSMAIMGKETVTHDAVDAVQFAWTIGGFLEISQMGVKPTLPEVGDFLNSRLVESYVAGASAPILSRLAAPVAMRMVRINSRYLAIAYGDAALGHFTQVLVFDSALNRWGKLAVNCVDVFAFPKELGGTTNNPMAVIAKDGTTWLVDTAAVSQLGVLVIGGVATTRSSLCEIDSVEAEVGDSATYGVTFEHFGTPDGLNMSLPTVVPPTLNLNGAMEWKFRRTFQHHYLRFTGNFNLTNVQIKVHQAGTR